ncbi:MAG: hypothetical protein N3G20_03280, partial [Verrucomicrobiae bacterium]|nr:hypothetical protein [Verrucomicrobiae bacterium]
MTSQVAERKLERLDLGRDDSFNDLRVFLGGAALADLIQTEMDAVLEESQLRGDPQPGPMARAMLELMVYC